MIPDDILEILKKFNWKSEETKDVLEHCFEELGESGIIDCIVIGLEY